MLQHYSVWDISSLIIKQNVPMVAWGFSFSVWKTVWTENLFPLPVLVWHFLFQTSQSYFRERMMENARRNLCLAFQQKFKLIIRIVTDSFFVSQVEHSLTN